MRAQIEAKTTINSLKLRELSEPSEIEEDEKVTEYQDGQNVIYAGIVTSVKKKYTKTIQLWHLLQLKIYMAQLNL